MFTSDDRDDFDDDSFLSHHKPFSPEQDQREEVHHNNHHYYHQLSLFNLPTPYHFPCFADDHFDYDPDLIQYHHQQQQQEQEQEQKQQRGEAAGDFAVGEENENGVAAVVEVEVEERVVVAPGRSSKKDRHSKITTARGPRDRRMRLSVEVAREFFDLQDMLGFDKASKTVEWLISQSKSAIKDIIRKVKGNGGIAASYASDCEIGFNPNSIDDDRGGRTAECLAGRDWSKRERKARQSRRRVDGNQQRSSSVTRESRMKARERARERTLEKKWKRSFEGSSLNNPRKPCSSPLEAGEDSSCNQDQTATTGSNLEILTQYEEIAGMAGRISIDVSSSDLVCSKWSPAAASSSNLNLQEIGIPQSVSS